MKTKSELLHDELNRLAFLLEREIEKRNEKVEDDFIACLNELYLQSLKDNYLWQYCPFQVYESSFSGIQERFKLLHPDTTIEDFLKYELDELYDYHKSVIYSFYFHNDKPVQSIFGKSYFYYAKKGSKEFLKLQLDLFSDKALSNLKYSTEKKIGFLEAKLFPPPIQYIRNPDGTYKIIGNSDSEEIANLKVKQQDSIEDIESSEGTIIEDSYQADSIKERITLLFELGVIDHLSKIPPFNYPNGLAGLLATIMNIQKTTLVSYLNPIINEGSGGNNNPLTPHLIKTVQSKLINMGVDQKYFKTQNTRNK